MTTATAFGEESSAKATYGIASPRLITVSNLYTNSIDAESTTLVGAGGVKLGSLRLVAGSRFTFDPIQTPMFVSSAPTFNAGAKIALDPCYANVSVGRIVLMTYGGSATIPSGLFDESSVAAGAACSLGEEPAPDGTNRQLVLTVGDYEHDAKEIRILVIGDSITQGYSKKRDGLSQVTQYRTGMAAWLAANGYRPKLLGHWWIYDADAADVVQPRDWAWHSGVSGNAIVTGRSYGGVRDNLHLFMDIAGHPDVVTLLIGTNDIGSQGRTGAATYELYKNLVSEIARLSPESKIVASTILPRSTCKAEVQSFNSLLLADLAAGGVLPQSLVCTNLYVALPQPVSNNDVYYFDGLHPTRRGASLISRGFAAKIMETLPIDSFRPRPDPDGTDEPQSALGAAATVPGDYLADMKHVFTIDIKSDVNVFSGVSPYTATNFAIPLGKAVSKAGYYMELVRKGTSRRRFVWVDFDAEERTLDEVDFPWRGGNLDFVVEKLHVYSNSPGVHNIPPDEDGVRGIVEGTWHNYVGGDDSTSEFVPADVMKHGSGYGDAFGWNDTLRTSGTGYACFQAHRIFSQSGTDRHWNNAEVLFAWNNWGQKSAWKVCDDIGIGTFADGRDDSYKGMDYTYTALTSTGTDYGREQMLGARAYSVRHIEIWAQPAPTVITVTNHLESSLHVEEIVSIRGAGGVKLDSLSMDAGAKIILDPIRTPVFVSSAPTFAAGAKIALSDNFKDVECGKVVLMTWRGAANVPRGLFDESSVTGKATLKVAAAPDGVSRQLVVTVGNYALAPEIRVLSVGDESTQGILNTGQGDYPQYRTAVAARLAARGYRPRFVGAWRKAPLDAAGVCPPDDWTRHCGFEGASVKTSARTGGLLDNMPLYLDIAGSPNVITLLIGANDMGINGKDGNETFSLWTNLICRVAAQRPDAKIVCSTLPLRTGDSDVTRLSTAKFNELLRACRDSEWLPPNIRIIDLASQLQMDAGSTGASGEGCLVPNWRECAEIAEAFSMKIADCLPLSDFKNVPDPTATSVPQTALGATAHDALEPYRRGFVHVLTINTASAANDLAACEPYTERNTDVDEDEMLDKVGYYFELVRKGTSRHRWVWVDMDATDKSLSDVGFPWHDAENKRIVSMLHVKSNCAGIHDVAPTNDTVRGIIEGTCKDYRPGGSLAEAPPNLSPGFGWNDVLNSNPGEASGYGCFQLHRIFSIENKKADICVNDAETLFAWNKWGSKQAASDDEVGIGTYACLSKDGYVNLDYTHPDDTDADLLESVLSSAYQIRHLEIWAKAVSTSFGEGDRACANREIILTGEQAAWLNARGDYTTVKNVLDKLSAEEFTTAFLLNLDFMKEGCGSMLKVTDIRMSDADQVTVNVELVRVNAVLEGGRPAPINGILRLRFASSLSGEPFVDCEEPITVANERLANDGKAICTFSIKSDMNFIRAVIVEK